MKTRFLAAVLLLVVGGGLAWFLLGRYSEREVSLPPWSEKELGPSREPPEVTLAPVTSSNTVRLAIGGFGLPDDQTGRLADLLTVELTQAEGLELVDRAALTAVLHEQELSLSGVVRAKDAVRIGKLVRADWFLLGSTHAIGSTNIIVARIVDVRTGIMRDIGVFETGSDLSKTAAALAGFTRQCRQAATTFTPRVFLAVGGFADVGVNNRQAAFPAQLRGYLLSAYQQSSLTLLERESVSALLQEVELDLAGLTENGGTNKPPPLRSAFWLVDGFFQSFETSGFEVELKLQVKRAFGETKRFTLRGAPGDLPPKVKDAIDQTLAQASPEVPGPTRRDEIEKQMQMGKDLLTSAWGNLLGGLNMGNELDDARRRYNVEEARHAFETVLLLEHDNREAKFYLGSCLSDWTIGRELEALPYLREIVSAKQKDQFAERGRWMIETIEYRNSMGRWSGRPDAATTTEPQDPEKLLAEILQKVEETLKIKHSWSGVGLDEFVTAFGTNTQEAAGALVPLWPKMKVQFPDLAPHLLVSMLSCQVDTNSPLVAEFRKSLAEYAQEPAKIFKCESFFATIAYPAYDWAMNKKLYELALEIMKARRQASVRSTEIPFERPDSVKLAFALVRLERWREALAVFEELGETPVDMDFDGPWGNMFRPFLPAKAAATCRSKLGLAPVEIPARFAFGSPCVCMHTPSSFAATDEGLWLAIGGKLIQLDFGLRTNLQAALPVEQDIPLTALQVGPDQLWIGTQGAGLIVYEKAAGKGRQITQQEGLLRNDVSCLWRRGNTLWIGFGHPEGNAVGNLGGLGNLDVSSGRIASFSQSMPTQPVSRVTWDFDKRADPCDGPPGHAITGLDGAFRNELWMLINEYGLRRYQPDDNSWNRPQGELEGEVVGFACDAERLVAGLSVEQIRVTLETKAAKQPGTNLVVRTNVMQTASELRRLQTDKNSPYVVRATSGGAYHVGALAIYDVRENRWQTLLEPGALWKPPTKVLLDGNDVWVAGSGYVAVVDSAQKAIRKMCYIPVRDPDRLQIAGGYLWAQFDKHLYRVPLSAAR